MYLEMLPLIVVITFAVVRSEPPVLAPQYGVPLNDPGLVGSRRPFNGPGPLNGPGPINGPTPLNGPGPGGPVRNFGGPNYYNENDIGGHGDHDHSQGAAYEFGYQVKDDFSGNNYGRQEKSDGNQVKGEYSVQLPDGRLQVVSYYADWKTGFHADVRYVGEANYPDQYNINGVSGVNRGSGINPASGINPGSGVNPINSQAGLPDNRYGPPRIDGNGGNFPVEGSGGRYLPPVDANQGNFNQVPIDNRYDNRNYDRGYNYNNAGGGAAGTGHVGVNDGINFDNDYSNYNRDKPLSVYGPP